MKNGFILSCLIQVSTTSFSKKKKKNSTTLLVIHKIKLKKETNINNFITVGLISVYTKNRLVFWYDDKELSLRADAIDCETLSLSLSKKKIIIITTLLQIYCLED